MVRETYEILPLEKKKDRNEIAVDLIKITGDKQSSGQNYFRQLEGGQRLLPNRRIWQEYRKKGSTRLKQTNKQKPKAKTRRDKQRTGHKQSQANRYRQWLLDTELGLYNVYCRKTEDRTTTAIGRRPDLDYIINNEDFTKITMKENRKTNFL